jgi:hypothetical protein
MYSKNLSRYWPWLLILIAAAAYYPRFVKIPAGMEMYPQAAACMLRGEMLQSCDIGFSYPPIFALLMLPLEPMPLWLRNLAWYLITIGATIGLFKLSEMIARRAIAIPLTAIELGWLRFLVLLLTLKLVLAVFENQAYDALVLVVLFCGLAAIVTGREAWGGAGLAFAAALKATPLIFLPYLLWKRHFVAAAAFVVVFIGASFLPDLFFTPAGATHGYFVSWLRDVAGASFGVVPHGADYAFWAGPNIMNHSIHGLVSLNIDEATHRALNHAVLYAVDAVFVIVVGTLITLTPRRPESIAIDGSLLLISMLMLSPMTSRSHYVALILPYTALIALGFRDNRTRNLGRAVLAASFILVTLSGNDVVGEGFTNWAYRHSAMALGTLVLLIYFAALVIVRYRQNGSTVAAPSSLAGEGSASMPLNSAG